MTLAVWADAVDVSISVCINARLRAAKTHPADPDGATYGQGGWDIGMHFMSLSHLASQLVRLLSQTPPHMCQTPYPERPGWLGGGQFCPPVAGKVTRLAINAHGMPGTLYAGGRPSTVLVRDPEREAQALSVENIPNITADLKRIHMATAPNATIILMGCIAGRGTEGTELLKALADVWPQRKIVAFETIGYQAAGEMLRSGQNCTEAGMRDTMSLFATVPGSAQPSHGPNWDNLNLMPWASESSPGAKVLDNGVITKSLTGD